MLVRVGVFVDSGPVLLRPAQLCPRGASLRIFADDSVFQALRQWVRRESVFALSQFRGPDYLGAWSKLRRRYLLNLTAKTLTNQQSFLNSVNLQPAQPAGLAGQCCSIFVAEPRENWKQAKKVTPRTTIGPLQLEIHAVQNCHTGEQRAHCLGENKLRKLLF